MEVTKVMNKIKKVILVTIINCIIAILTTSIIMYILKMDINLENFMVVFISVLVIFFLGDLVTM